MAFHRLDMTVSLESRVDELDGTGEIHSGRAIYTNKSWTIITHTTCMAASGFPVGFPSRFWNPSVSAACCSAMIDRGAQFLQTILYGPAPRSFIELGVPFDPALIAQLVERVTSNDEVAGSTPS
jgi:hypothetical protein